MTRLDILAIAGSLRAALNSAMVRAARQHAPADIDVTIYDALREIPPYDQDLDTDERTPAIVRDLRTRIKAADGLRSRRRSTTTACRVCSRTRSTGHRVPRPPRRCCTCRSRSGRSTGQLRHRARQQHLRQLFLWTDSRVVTKPEVMAFKVQNLVGPDGEIRDENTIDLIRDLLGALARLRAVTDAELDLQAAAATA